MKCVLSLNNSWVNSMVSWTHSWAAAQSIINNELESIRQGGTWKAERVITSKQDAKIHVQGKSVSVINFCANNYLGLSVI